MFTRPSCGIVPLLFVVLLANANAGEIYRWVDESGTVTYSSTKPVGHATQQMEISAPPSSHAAQKSPQDLVIAAEKTRAERLERAKEMTEKQSVAATREQLCLRARSNLEGFESNVRAFHVDQSGERVRIGEEQRQEDISKLEALAKKFCD
jgi:hypothetical protein